MPPLRHILRRLRDETSGSVAILTALTFPILVGGMALGAEVSYWYLSQRKLQQASDLAAYAAAVQLRSGREDAAMLSSASNVAAASGLRAGEDALAMDYPPATGARSGDARAVEVRLARQQTRFFTLLYSEEPVPISARAVAEVRGGSDACLLALDPVASGAITVSGSANITFDGCDVATNSTARDAFDMNGGAVTMTAGCVHSVGGAETNSNLILQNCDRPRLEAPVVPDPYADIAEPAVPASCSADPNVGKNNKTASVAPSQTLADGTAMECYSGGLNVRGEVDFEPGLYIIDGGEFRVNSNAALTGEGVTFLLKNGATLDFNGNAEIDFAAPVSGPYAGIVFFGSRSDGGVTHKINGSAGSAINGAVYLPSANLTYSGNFDGAGGCVQIVARTVELTGNSELSGGCAAPGTRRIAVNETIALVE